MYLSKLLLNPSSQSARKDIADPYQMHSTLCRAFSPPELKCSAGEFLWRLEPEVGGRGGAVLLVQSRSLPHWERISYRDWLVHPPSIPLPFEEKLRLNSDLTNVQFRYRIRINPSVKRDGRRIGLYSSDDYLSWFEKQAGKNGFRLHSLHYSEDRMLWGQRHDGGRISLFSVLFDGVLQVSDSSTFVTAVKAGIGHGKAFGLGMLSVVPLPVPNDLRIPTGLHS